MASSRNISTVFFDYGDTLVENRPTYLMRVTELLGEFGHEFEYDAVVGAYAKADYLVYLDIVSGALGGADRYFMTFLNHFGNCLGIEMDWPKALPEITRRFEDDEFERVLSEGTLEMLQALQGQGLRLGIISNNDGTCREKCEEVGIDGYFEIIVDSTTEGVGKPSPRIFEIALERMAVSAAESAHVGDMYGADVLGARDVGMSPVWYNRRGLEALDDYRPEFEINRLLEIPGIL
jgi:putative hydrolase of the HAD superfamily